MLELIFVFLVGLFFGAVVLAVLCAIAVKRDWGVLNVVGVCLVGMLGVLGAAILLLCDIYECPNCKNEIKRKSNPCPYCNKNLNWSGN